MVLLTAFYRGGIGIRALGGAVYGGKYYVFVLGSIVGYFALTAEAIPMAKARKMNGWFWFSGMSNLLGTLAYNGGPAFYFLFYFLSSDFVISQALSDNGLTNIDRIGGMAPTCTAALCLLLAQYGIRGIFDLVRPWRVLFFFLTVVGSFFAGFRSITILLFLIFAFQFYFEGLLRTHYLPIVAGLAICGMAPILFFSSSMPAAVQRAISFLPVNVDSEVLAEATGSAEWRFQMWDAVEKEIPKYLIIGKGYAIDPNEIFAVNEAARTGMSINAYEGSMLAGDYHNGPLSVIIPFGLFGVIGFLWVLIAGFRVLHANYRFGDARLRRMNTLFLSFYLAQAVSFFFIFGAFNSEMSVFLGVCGMSVSLNGGVKRRSVRRPKPIPVPHTLAMEPG